MHTNILNTRNRIKLSIFVSLLVVLFGTLVSPLTSAQSASDTGGQALEIGPTVFNLDANPGDSVSIKVGIRDVSPTSLIVRGQVNDFVASGEDGVPKIILDDDAKNPYSLKNWVSKPDSMTLKPKELKMLPITINVPSSASPGGYYGVIRFTSNPPELEGTGVALSASVGALVILKVNGDAKQQMSIEEFSTSKNGKTGNFFETTPIQFTERVKNSGNIHEEPTGLVTVTDMFGNKVVNLMINQPPGKVLPDSIRKFTQPLDNTSIGNRILFGLYHADLTVNYGDGQTAKSSLSFWVIPYTMIIIIILGLVAAFFLLRHLLRRYNRAVIARAKRHK